jgi:hypothetical protein
MVASETLLCQLKSAGCPQFLSAAELPLKGPVSCEEFHTCREKLRERVWPSLCSNRMCDSWIQCKQGNQMLENLLSLFKFGVLANSYCEM